MSAQGQPFRADGAEKPHLKWSGHKRPYLMWQEMSHELIGDDAGTYKVSGDSYLPVGLARPVGRVVAKTHLSKHGLADYLSTDAAFCRYMDNEVFMQDRIAESHNAGKRKKPDAQQAIAVQGPPRGFGQPEEGGGIDVEAGPSGRRPYVDPWLDIPSKYANGPIQKTITFVGPSERKLHQPYGLTVRGSSFGIEGTRTDNFFLPADHYHISDHKGPPTNLPKPDERRSTRIYDINHAGAPSIDEIDSNGRLVSRGYNQKLDRTLVVQRDAGGGAGGDYADMNLAFNLSGRTGFAYGLSEFRAMPAFVPEEEGPKNPRETDARPKPGTGDKDHYDTAIAKSILATMAYERGGPFSPGHPGSDKHEYDTNLDGIPYNPVHIHINAKYTNESEVFDGRRNMNPVFEPPVGHGLIPIRSYEQFRPDLPDPFFYRDQIGGWDFHTRMPSLPVYDEPQPKRPVDEPQTKDETQPKDETQVKTGEPQNKDGDPDEPQTKEVQRKEGGDPGAPQGLPQGETPPIIPGRSQGEGVDTSEPGDRTKPPSDWGPTETVRPSAEIQPRPGNTEAPNPKAGNIPSPLPDDNGRGVPHGDDIDLKKALERIIEDMEVKGAGLSVMDKVTMPIAGVPYQDYMRAPKTLHQIGYYKHKYDTPRANQRRALLRQPPEYTVKPIYKEGNDMSFPKQHRWGTSAGLTLFAPIELESWEARHDYDAGKIDPLSPQDIVYYPGVRVGFGYAGDTWDKVANGFVMYQGAHPIDGTVDKGMYFECVGADGEHDSTRAYQFLNPLYDMNGNGFSGDLPSRLIAADGEDALDGTSVDIFINTDVEDITVLLDGIPRDGQRYRLIASGTSGNTVTVMSASGENVKGSGDGFQMKDGNIVIVSYNPTEKWW